jgi:hypothetical protein
MEREVSFATIESLKYAACEKNPGNCTWRGGEEEEAEGRAAIERER